MKDITKLNADKLKEFLSDHKCEDIVAIDVSGECTWTECFVIATVSSVGHLRGVVHQIWDEIKELGMTVKDLEELTEQAADYGKKGSLVECYKILKASEKGGQKNYPVQYQITEESAGEVLAARMNSILEEPENAAIIQKDDKRLSSRPILIRITITDGMARRMNTSITSRAAPICNTSKSLPKGTMYWTSWSVPKSSTSIAQDMNSEKEPSPLPASLTTRRHAKVPSMAIIVLCFLTSDASTIHYIIDTSLPLP